MPANVAEMWNQSLVENHQCTPAIFPTSIVFSRDSLARHLCFYTNNANVLNVFFYILYVCVIETFCFSFHNLNFQTISIYCIQTRFIAMCGWRQCRGRNNHTQCLCYPSHTMSPSTSIGEHHISQSHCQYKCRWLDLRKVKTYPSDGAVRCNQMDRFIFDSSICTFAHSQMAEHTHHTHQTHTHMPHTHNMPFD